MSTLLLRNIRFAVSCDGADRCLEGTDILCRDGLIQEMGPGLTAQADEVIDCTGMLCYPGLVNTHHHLYQCFSRNLPQVQGLELFDWLRALYEIWKNLDRERSASPPSTAMGEMMKHGCTTCFDHHTSSPGAAGTCWGSSSPPGRPWGCGWSAPGAAWT